MQAAIYPDTPFHSRTGPFPGYLEWLEADDESRNDVACFSRKNRRAHYFINSLVRRASVFQNVTNLLGLWQFPEGELCFGRRVQFSDIGRIGRRQNRAGAILKVIQ